MSAKGYDVMLTKPTKLEIDRYIGLPIFFPIFKHFIFTFTFMHLADAFIQSDLQCIQDRLYIFISMCVPWESNPQPFALLTQCSTTEPQEHHNFTIIGYQFCKKISFFFLGHIHNYTEYNQQ